MAPGQLSIAQSRCATRFQLGGHSLFHHSFDTHTQRRRRRRKPRFFSPSFFVIGTYREKTRGTYTTKQQLPQLRKFYSRFWEQLVQSALVKCFSLLWAIGRRSSPTPFLGGKNLEAPKSLYHRRREMDFTTNKKFKVSIKWAHQRMMSIETGTTPTGYRVTRVITDTHSHTHF